MRNRVYSPSMGRFFQPDPNATAMTLIEASAHHGRGMDALVSAFDVQGLYGDGMNLYEYLGSSPWRRSDPLGLSWDPFDMVDEYLAEDAGSKAAFMSALGQGMKATAILAATIASYLPFPFVGNLGEVALYALGETTGDDLAVAMALGLIPGGKLAAKFGGLGGRSSGRSAHPRGAAQSTTRASLAVRCREAQMGSWRGHAGSCEKRADALRPRPRSGPHADWCPSRRFRKAISSSPPMRRRAR